MYPYYSDFVLLIQPCPKIIAFRLQSFDRWPSYELSHAIAGLFTCAEIESVQTDADQRGATRTRVGN